MTSDANTGGVGPDGVYRDPWKKPYIITMDANSDEKSRDSFYRSGTVSADPSNAARGLFGMIPVKVNNTTWYEVNQPVIAWSAGPDGLINKNKSAIQDANKDNVISWGQ